MSRNIEIKIDTMSMQNMIDEDSELIPLLTPEDEEEMNKELVPETLAILPLRNTVLFPGVVIPITASRDKAIALIKAVNKGGKILGIVAQKDPANKNPTYDDIYHTGVVAQILRVLKMPDGNTTVIIQGKKRMKVEAIVSDEPYLTGTTVEMIDDVFVEDTEEFKEIIKTVKETALSVVEENPNIPTEGTFAIKNIQSNAFLINFISSNIDLSVKEKQELLEITNIKDRAIAILKKLNKELQRLELRNDIQNKTRIDLDQQQKEYYLNQQLKTIQEELGGNSHEAEVQELIEKGKKKKWSKEVKETFEKEVARMKRLNSQMPEYAIQRNYLELMLELPWGIYSKDKFKLNKQLINW